MAQVRRVAKEVRSVRHFCLLLPVGTSLTRTRPGELIYLNAGGQPIVVLNSQRVATDLLDRRSRIYSDRPRLIVASDIMCAGLAFALSRYGEM
jgi:hypothetical protein